MNVALDGADDHRADLGRPGLDQQRPQDLHPGLHRLGRHQHFRYEQHAVAKIRPDDIHPADEGFRQDVVRRQAAFQQDADAGRDLGRQPVIQIVLHL